MGKGNRRITRAKKIAMAEAAKAAPSPVVIEAKQREKQVTKAYNLYRQLEYWRKANADNPDDERYIDNVYGDIDFKLDSFPDDILAEAYARYMDKQGLDAL